MKRLMEKGKKMVRGIGENEIMKKYVSVFSAFHALTGI